MSQGEGRGKQKTPRGDYPRKDAVNPQGTAGVRSSSPVRNAGLPSEEEQYDLMEQVVERKNMLSALHRVQQNKGAAGVDGMGVETLVPFLKERWQGIRKELLKGTYEPAPVRRVEIPKPDGGVRLLGIPTVLDRLIQQALLQVLTPVFDPEFSEHSYGFRPGKSAHQR
jgi:retron-type reverse transcriptase